MDNTLKIDTSKTVASNPGNITLKPLIWITSIIPRFMIMTFGFIFSGILSFKFSFWFLPIFVVFGLVNYFYWKVKKIHFKKGDSNGGLVVSESPCLIAITTDLRKLSNRYYPVVKIIEYSKKAKLGSKIPTVAIYSHSSVDNNDCWSDFEPVPADYATNNNEELQNALLSYKDEEWITLDSRLKQVPKPFSIGLYKVDIEESDWKGK